MAAFWPMLKSMSNQTLNSFLVKNCIFLRFVVMYRRKKSQFCSTSMPKSSWFGKFCVRAFVRPRFSSKPWTWLRNSTRKSAGKNKCWHLSGSTKVQWCFDMILLHVTTQFRPQSSTKTTTWPPFRKSKILKIVQNSDLLRVFGILWTSNCLDIVCRSK